MSSTSYNKPLSYSIIQLEASPSRSRKCYTRPRVEPTYTTGTDHMPFYDLNTTFDSTNEPYSKSGYSYSVSSKQSFSPVNTPSFSSSNSNQRNYHTISNISDYRNRRKSSYENLVDPLDNSKNASSFTISQQSDVANSECNSIVSLNKLCNKPCDRYGFFLESDDEYDKKTPTPQDLKDLRNREKKWLDMLHNWKYYINFKWEKIRDRCRKGVPHSLRSQAWFYLCGAQIQKRRNPRLYNELLNRDIPEEVKSDICKDLHRQFPNHELFAEESGSGQVDLYSVLKAFAVYKPNIGYCQAQGPLAAVLLMHMPAENAFWSLVSLNDYYIGGYFLQNLEDIQIHGQMLFAFTKRFCPYAYNLLKRQNIEPVLYMTEWFMCVFSRTLPWPSVLRVWDMFLCEGVTVLFRVGLYLIDISLKNENSKTCPTMYETWQKLRNIPQHFLQEETLVRAIRRYDLKDSDLLKQHKVQIKKYKKLKRARSENNNINHAK